MNLAFMLAGEYFQLQLLRAVQQIPAFFIPLQILANHLQHLGLLVLLGRRGPLVIVFGLRRLIEQINRHRDYKQQGRHQQGVLILETGHCNPSNP
ncbi:hypothetical protein D3C73_1437220 [compost metagenome]